MSKLKVAGGVVAVGGVGALAAIGGGLMYVNAAVDGHFAKTWETHEASFPIPAPLTEAELTQLREEKKAELPADAPEDADPLEGVDLDKIALERAIERGKHYTTSIYACTACHGSDFGGGTMMDAMPVGVIRAPNITAGGKTKDYTAVDWDRAVRHGVLPGGASSMMPVLDFKALTDRELADMIAYIQSLPAKEGGETERTWGPVGKMLITTGSLVADVYKVDHAKAHAAEPPPVGATLEYGTHIINICSGCHRETFNGGPMPFGPPDWPPAGNLTPHEDGMAGWSFDDFKNTLQKGKRPDGTLLKPPMSEMLPFAMNMSDDELMAMYIYLQQLPPTPTGE